MYHIYLQNLNVVSFNICIPDTCIYIYTVYSKFIEAAAESGEGLVEGAVHGPHLPSDGHRMAISPTNFRPRGENDGGDLTKET